MKVISSLARIVQKVVGIRFFFIWFEARFFNFATNKANCGDWLILILNMAHFNQNNYQNKSINTLIVSALRSQQVQELGDSINITYGILDSISHILHTENLAVTQIIPTILLNSSEKSESDIANIIKKTPNFMRKTKKNLKKPLMTLKQYIQIFQKKGKKKGLLGMWVFSANQNLGITA